MNLRARAEIIARLAHAGQVDKSGVPYVEHLRTVASMVESEDAKTVAWLHDTVEDTPLALHDLSELGFPPRIVDAVRLLTHTHEHSHADYVRAIRDADTVGADLARLVKRADLAHNADPTRATIPLEKLQRRYAKALAILDGTEP